MKVRIGVILIILTILMIGSVNAATINTDKSKVKTGEKIVVTVSTTKEIKNTDFSMTYNTNLFKYVGITTSLTEDPAVNNVNGEVHVSMSSASKTTKAVSLTFEALKNTEVGNATFTIDEETYNNGGVEKLTQPSVTVAVEENSQQGGTESGTGIEWTDVSNAEFQIIKDGVMHKSNYLTLKGVEINEQSTYFIMISNSATKPSDAPKEGSKEVPETAHHITSNNSRILIDEYLEKNGDIYIWFYELGYNADKTTSEIKELISGKKVERPALESVGSRMKAFFFADYTSSFVYEMSLSEGRKINVKIGTVTDNSILKAIRDGKSGCLDNLLTYAKSAKSIYTGAIPVGKSEIITNKMNLTNKAYYYVYLELEDENGKYSPLEDVSLYQALVNKEMGLNSLCDYLDDNFKWNLTDDKTSSPKDDEDDDTIATDPIPQTGKNAIMIGSILGIIAIIGTISYIQYRRYKEIK